MDDRALKERVRWNASRFMEARGTYPSKLARDRDIPLSKVIQWLRTGQGMTLRGLAGLAEALEVDPQALLEPLPAVLPPKVDGRRRSVKKDTDGGV
jgi:hypothetical protein